MVYLLKMVIFYGYVSQNQMVVVSSQGYVESYSFFRSSPMDLDVRADCKEYTMHELTNHSFIWLTNAPTKS